MGIIIENGFNIIVNEGQGTTPTPTPSITPTNTLTPTPTNTLTPTPTITLSPSITPTITVTPTNTLTPTPSVTPTNTITPTVTTTPTPTPSQASASNTFSLSTTSVTPLSGTTLSYYTDNSLTGLLYGGLNVGLNASITKVWSYGTYSSRTYAPATTVLMARPRTGYPYSNNWESTWWLSNTTGVTNDGLLVEFNTTKTFTSISVGNPQELYASNQGSLQVWLVTGMSGNTMTSATLLGTVALSTTTTMATLNVSATGNLLWFRRTGSTGWSRLERIQINGS